MATVWYRVSNLDAGRVFFRDVLGFEETSVGAGVGWTRLTRGSVEIAVSEGRADEEGGVANVDVEDVKAEADRLRAAGVDVGVVLELAGEIRLVDVFDPDGNRIQLVQSLT